jgi:hypothetical protein
VRIRELDFKPQWRYPITLDEVGLPNRFDQQGMVEDVSLLQAAGFSDGWFAESDRITVRRR